MTGRRFGGFWRRFFAYLIDRIVLYLVSIFLFAIGALSLGHSGHSLGRIMATGEIPRGMGLFFAVYTATMFATDMIYFTWFHGSVGQTPGKMLLGLRVIQVSGEPVTFGVAFLRWVGSLISGLFLWLGYLWIAFDGRKQGWHDKIAATLVVRRGSEPDDRSSSDGAVWPPPGPPAARISADPGSAVPTPLPAVRPAEADHPGGASRSDSPGPAGVFPSSPCEPGGVSATTADRPARVAAFTAPADGDPAGPASGAPNDLPGRK